MSANSVSALAYRARAGLREAYLHEHLTGNLERLPEPCQQVRPELAAAVRGSVRAKERRRIDAHLDGCAGCMAAYVEVQELNNRLGAAGSLLGTYLGGSALVASLASATPGLGVLLSAAIAAIAAAVLPFGSVPMPDLIPGGGPETVVAAPAEQEALPRAVVASTPSASPSAVPVIAPETVAARAVPSAPAAPTVPAPAAPAAPVAVEPVPVDSVVVVAPTVGALVTVLTETEQAVTGLLTEVGTGLAGVLQVLGSL